MNLLFMQGYKLRVSNHLISLDNIFLCLQAQEQLCNINFQRTGKKKKGEVYNYLTGTHLKYK